MTVSDAVADPRAGPQRDQARPGPALRTEAFRRAAPLLGVVLALAACAGEDPIERARIAAGRAPTATLPPVPGQGETFPNLGSVPARPATTSPEARRALENALVADRANARHVGQPATPVVPRAQVAEATPSPTPLGQTAPSLLGPSPEEQPPIGVPPPPPPPPIAGSPQAPSPPPASPAAPSAAPDLPSPAPPARIAEAAPPPIPPTRPAPPQPVETAPIGRVAVEALAPPPPAMPEELPQRSADPARPPAAALPPARPQPLSPDPPPVLLPAERAAPPSVRAAAPAVVVDRTALLPVVPAAEGPGYALDFLPGTVTLAAADRAVLADLAARSRGATFRITGFGDAGGTRALDLPLARARAVADALRAAGVAAEQIELGGSARPGPAGRGAEVRLIYSR